ncbi:MAG: MFS transporter, partial [Rubrivivax sp.]
AQAYGWQTVYAFAAAAILVPMIVMIVFAKEPPDVDAHASLRQHVACLFEKDGWAFSLIYGVTFGGFIGLTTFLPTYYYDQFGVSKVQAGQLTMLAAFMGAAVRVVGGALFQLVPLRWPAATAVAGSMIGEIGALGGGLVPNLMGLSKQHAGTYLWGFVIFGVLAVLMLGVMRVMQIRWTRTWAEKGGRARQAAASAAEPVNYQRV